MTVSVQVSFYPLRQEHMSLSGPGEAHTALGEQTYLAASDSGSRRVTDEDHRSGRAVDRRQAGCLAER